MIASRKIEIDDQLRIPRIIPIQVHQIKSKKDQTLEEAKNKLERLRTLVGKKLS